MSVYDSDLSRSIHATARGLSKSGLLSATAFREIEARCLVATPNPQDVSDLREREALSLEDLARLLNLAPQAIEQWESGERRLEGPALRLFDLIRRKGIDAVR